jgi:hypothetical protein
VSRKNKRAAGYAAAGSWWSKYDYLFCLQLGHMRICRLSGEENFLPQHRQDTFSHFNMERGFFSDIEDSISPGWPRGKE